MSYKVKNNVFAELAADAPASATTITLVAGQGVRFPILGVDDWCYATLQNPANQKEIVRVTLVDGDVLTCVRGVDDTVARDFVAGDRIDMRPVAALFNEYSSSVTGALNSAAAAQAAADAAANKADSATVTANNASNTANGVDNKLIGVNSRLDNAGGTGVTVEQSLTSSANNITGLQGQYTVKIDVNGYVSGFGLASTANNGVPTSEFVVNADKFSIVTPSNPAIHPFTVGTIGGVTKTVITSAVIGDATIDFAKINTASITSLAALSTSTGALSVTGTLTVNTGALTGTTMTGSGAQINANGTFALGNASTNITYNGTAITLNGPVVANSNLAAGAVSASKFATGIEPVTIVSAVPSTKSTSSIFNTADSKLYRWNGTAYVASVAAVDVSGTLSDAQIAAVAAAKLTGQITTTQITDNAISTPKIAAGAVTANQIAANTITAAQIAANTITAAQIAANTITASQIAANTITASQIAANTITGGQIAAGAISASQIAAGSVTTDRLLVSASNLIPNPDFATGDFTNWRPFGTPANLSVIPSSTAGVPAGATSAYVCKMLNAAGGQVSIFAFASAYADTNAPRDGFVVTQGEQYSIKVDMAKTSDLAATTLAVQVYFYKSDGTHATNIVVLDLHTALTTSFATYAGSFTVPAGGLRCWPYVNFVGTAGSVYWSNLRCKRMADSSLVVDGGIKANHLSVTSLNAITATTGALTVNDLLTISTGGALSFGQTAYNTGTGGWIQGGATPKISLKTANGSTFLCDPANNVLSFNGANVTGSTVTSSTIDGSTTSVSNTYAIATIGDVSASIASTGSTTTIATVTLSQSGGKTPYQKPQWSSNYVNNGGVTILYSLDTTGTVATIKANSRTSGGNSSMDITVTGLDANGFGFTRKFNVYCDAT